MKYLLTVLLVFISCSSKNYKYIETLRDTTIYVNADSSMISYELECDTNNNVLIKNVIEVQAGKIVSVPKIFLKDNILNASAKTDTQKIVVQIKEVDKVVEVLVPKPLNLIQKILIIIGLFCVSAGLCWFTLKFI